MLPPPPHTHTILRSFRPPAMLHPSFPSFHACNASQRSFRSFRSFLPLFFQSLQPVCFLSPLLPFSFFFSFAPMEASHSLATPRSAPSCFFGAPTFSAIILGSLRPDPLLPFFYVASPIKPTTHPHFASKFRRRPFLFLRSTLPIHHPPLVPSAPSAPSAPPSAPPPSAPISRC